MASTLAKLALTMWRSRFLAPNTIVNFPEEGMNLRMQQSHGALRFFKVLEKFTGLTIRTAAWQIGEHRDPETGYRVDGQIDRHTFVEYYGCYYHGKKL